MSINAHDEYIVASRGTGKSEGIDARIILRNVWEMPGSLGGLISPSYAKAWGNTLPAICKALAEWGYIQGIHYVVGHKAPESMGFAKPVRPVLGDGWSNAFHFLEWYRHGNSLLQSRNVRKLYVTRLGDRSRS